MSNSSLAYDASDDAQRQQGPTASSKLVSNTNGTAPAATTGWVRNATSRMGRVKRGIGIN